MQFLCDLIVVILGYLEIVRFKIEKEQNYFIMIKKLATYEFQYSNLMSEFWQFILNNKNIFMSPAQ